MAGILLADGLGLEVPSELKAKAVVRSPPMDHQLPSFILRQSKPSSSLPSNNPVSVIGRDLWQEDQDLDLDELGEWVPDWACRMSRSQILDIEAMQAYEALRASSHSTPSCPPIRIFKSGGYVLAHLEAMLIQSRLNGVLEVTRTIKDADCVVAKSTWSDGRHVDLSHHKRAARHRGIPFVAVSSLRARELVLKLRPLLIERGLQDPSTALTHTTAARKIKADKIKADMSIATTCISRPRMHMLISLSSDDVKQARPKQTRFESKGDRPSDEDILKLQGRVLRGEMTLVEFTHHFAEE